MTLPIEHADFCSVSVYPQSLPSDYELKMIIEFSHTGGSLEAIRLLLCGRLFGWCLQCIGSCEHDHVFAISDCY